MSRTPRTAQNRNLGARKAQQRPLARAVHTGKLYVPPEIIPDGVTYAWVRVATLSQPDADNWSSKTSIGWKPVPRDRHPDHFPSLPIPGFEDKTSSQVIMRGDGLILCEAPTVEVKARRAALRQENLELIESIKWTGQDAGTNAVLPTADYGSDVGIERVTAMPKPAGGAEFKE